MVDQTSTGTMMRAEEFRIRFAPVFGDATYQTTVPELRGRLSTAGAVARRRLAAGIVELAEDVSALRDETLRIFLGRLLAALVPDSLNAVRTTLRRPTNDITGEMQFSLLVAFTELPSLLTEQDRAAVLTEVHEFLLHARDDSVHAPWMAGDLLGDHWPLEESLPKLLHLACHAEHRVGREGAIHGLSHALTRATKRQQWSIIAGLKEVLQNDDEDAVRSYAESVMGSARGL